MLCSVYFHCLFFVGVVYSLCCMSFWLIVHISYVCCILCPPAWKNGYAKYWRLATNQPINQSIKKAFPCTELVQEGFSLYRTSTKRLFLVVQN